jgi:hypothetical protein
MNLFQKLKTFWVLYSEGKKLLKGGSMKSWTGIVKVVTYVAMITALVLSWLDPKTSLIVLASISALIKVAEIIIQLTPSKIDDERLAEIIKILKEKGIIKLT